jgi:hypothetical protein
MAAPTVRRVSALKIGGFGALGYHFCDMRRAGAAHAAIDMDQGRADAHIPIVPN